MSETSELIEILEKQVETNTKMVDNQEHLKNIFVEIKQSTRIIKDNYEKMKDDYKVMRDAQAGFKIVTDDVALLYRGENYNLISLVGSIRSAIRYLIMTGKIIGVIGIITAGVAILNAVFGGQ